MLDLHTLLLIRLIWIVRNKFWWFLKFKILFKRTSVIWLPCLRIIADSPNDFFMRFIWWSQAIIPLNWDSNLNNLLAFLVRKPVYRVISILIWIIVKSPVILLLALITCNFQSLLRTIFNKVDDCWFGLILF